MNNFEKLKTELCEKAKQKNACSSEYRIALKAETESELLIVISDNLDWCVSNECVSHEYFSKFTPKIYLESGIANFGKENVGYRNTGNRNTGAFCTGESKIKLFNKESNWTHEQFIESKVYSLLCEVNTNMWIWESEMSNEQKEKYPSFKTSGGCLVDTPYKQAFSDRWNNWSEENKNEFKSLPNFDADIFEQITGVKI